MDWAKCPIWVLSISLQKIITYAYYVKLEVSVRMGSFPNQTLITVTHISSILPYLCTIIYIVAIFGEDNLRIDLSAESMNPSMRSKRSFHYTTTLRTQLTDQYSCKLVVVIGTWITHPWTFAFLPISSTMNSLISFFSLKYRATLV